MQKFKYISFRKRYNLSDELIQKIDKSAILLASEMKKIDVDSLSISEYNKHYLKKYLQFVDFYLVQYVQLFINVIENIDKPVNESTFVDYGGGTGVLSYLAKYIGFKNVIYIDIYDVSCKDAKIISKALDIEIERFVVGDIKNIIEISRSTKIDVICSMDVFEHIYDWKDWFLQSKKVKNNPLIIFKTGANPSNPFINAKLKNNQNKAELTGYNIVEGWKSRDKAESFLEIRKQIISKKYPNLNNQEVQYLSKVSRGLVFDDIILLVDNYLKNGNVSYKNNHPTNTCDPYTGNWDERLVYKKELNSFLNENNFRVDVVNGLYSKYPSLIKNIFVYIFNAIIFLSNKKSLFLSPTYTLIAKNKTI